MSALGRKHEHQEPRTPQRQHVEPGRNAIVGWALAFIVVAASVGLGWGWLASGGLFRLLEEVGR